MVTDIRLASHQLAEPEFEHPEDLISWMGAVQAQDYAMSKWAVGLRLKSGTMDQVNDALATGKIVRTHVMRPTWHYVAGKDLRWMLQLTGERVKKAIDSWVKGSGLDISEELYTKCNDLIGKMLSGNHCLTREEIETELGRQGMPTADDLAKRCILRAEVEGIVCSGADKNGKFTYALLDEQVVPAPLLHREEALARLALCYFRSHSPATLQDFVWWSGLTVTEAKQAIRLIKQELITEHFDGQEFLIYANFRQAKTDDILHFLPSYDEYLIAYKDRTTVMTAKYHPKAFNRWRIFYPVILRNGRIVGNWSKEKKKGELMITTSFFEPDKKGTKLLKPAENRYRAFLENEPLK